MNNCSQTFSLFSRCFCWGAPGRFFGVLVVSGVTGGVHFRWYFWKVCVFWGKGGTIDFERPYNDLAVFWSSAASRKASKMRKKYVRKFVVFLDVENTYRNGVFIFFWLFRGPSWVPGVIFRQRSGPGPKGESLTFFFFIFFHFLSKMIKYGQKKAKKVIYQK